LSVTRLGLAWQDCTHLALSSNQIDKLCNFGALENLEILSVGRNNIKKMELLDSVGDVSTAPPHPSETPLLLLSSCRSRPGVHRGVTSAAFFLSPVD